MQISAYLFVKSKFNAEDTETTQRAAEITFQFKHSIPAKKFVDSR
jgi:hypothetical protein